MFVKQIQDLQFALRLAKDNNDVIGMVLIIEEFVELLQFLKVSL